MTHQHNKIYALGFNDGKFRLIGIPLLGLIVPSIFFGKSFSMTDEYLMSVGMSLFYTALYWHICRAYFIWGNRRYPEVGQYKKRLIHILALCFVTMLVLCNTMHLCLEKYLMQGIFPTPTAFQINAASFFSYLMIAGMYESSRYVMLWKKTSLEKEQLQRENIESQLEGLKNQVNPHFLFNSLNTLVNIIPEHPDNAVRFVQKLSKVYRYILEIRDTQTTPLSKELDFLNAYIFLLKERFGENLHIHIDPNTEGVLEKDILPLSLQILFENAIKHNIISAQRPLTIEVSVENDMLIVKNNLQKKNQIQEGTGFGLQNIKNRYKLLCNKNVEVIITQQSFIVSLPLL
jgi:two-component system, LytTR family, sensor kinase